MPAACSPAIVPPGLDEVLALLVRPLSLEECWNKVVLEQPGALVQACVEEAIPGAIPSERVRPQPPRVRALGRVTSCEGSGILHPQLTWSPSHRVHKTGA
jgi:hypothetical protein